MILWWAQVTVTPDESKTTVFKRGTLKVSKDSNLTGGQVSLVWASKHKELLKNDQKNLEKNITSEKINKIILDLNLAITSSVCNLIIFDSQVISRHQLYKTFASIKTLKNVKLKVSKANQITSLKRVLKVAKQV